MATTKTKKRITYSISAAFCLIIISLFYFWQIGTGISNKYQTRSLQTEIKELKTENQHLKNEVADLQSISRVQNFALEQGMAQANKTVYLPIITSEIAINK